METTTKTIELIVETSKTVLLMKPPVATTIFWCATCGRNVQMLPAERAAKVAGLGTRQIYQMIEAGELHFVELADGRLLVCSKSLGKEGL